MKNVKFDHALSFYILRKVFSHFFSKKTLGLSKAIGVFEFPLPCNRKFECSVHIFRGPWATQLVIPQSKISSKNLGPSTYNSGFLRPNNLMKLIWPIISKFQINWGISSNVRGLLEKSELQHRIAYFWTNLKTFTELCLITLQVLSICSQAHQSVQFLFVNQKEKVEGIGYVYCKMEYNYLHT